jgi:hypothetical protein
VKWVSQAGDLGYLLSSSAFRPAYSFRTFQPLPGKPPFQPSSAWAHPRRGGPTCPPPPRPIPVGATRRTASPEKPVGWPSFPSFAGERHFSAPALPGRLFFRPTGPEPQVTRLSIRGLRFHLRGVLRNCRRKTRQILVILNGTGLREESRRRGLTLVPKLLPENAPFCPCSARAPLRWGRRPCLPSFHPRSPVLLGNDTSPPQLCLGNPSSPRWDGSRQVAGSSIRGLRSCLQGVRGSAASPRPGRTPYRRHPPRGNLDSHSSR